MKTKCPRCGKIVSWKNNPFRPFCSETCKLIDLGHWLEQDYVLPSLEKEIYNFSVKQTSLGEKNED